MTYVLWVLISIGGTAVSQHSETFDTLQKCKDMGDEIKQIAKVVEQGFRSPKVAYTCKPK